MKIQPRQFDEISSKRPPRLLGTLPTKSVSVVTVRPFPRRHSYYMRGGPGSEDQKDNGKLAQITTDPVEVAEEAGLRYVSDEQPGYTRKRKGKSFLYFDTGGES